ncbi:hypothetical protein D1155_07885 [Anaerotruncus sp. 80]|uniref:Phage-related protein n=1 Tax=Anaerotruncus colihominis TaxID=169435 RepID=A0A845QLJ3_9FIRM|nr:MULTISPECIES: hypothetical protein [Anaerotruncus]NBH61567.1 hypothetical protein [Anaerotruncus colihominis]NCF02222.1 hypothetical protein [Anaerotruncus sp. 80]
MAAESVGQIGLDLVVNQNQFNKQMKGITSLAKKAGAALAGAFAVKKLVDFTASCIELGSDLQEVQNVVDVAFPHMSAEMDKWSKSAATSFGLSETMAKRYAGTFGSMSKAFGFTEKEAYEMSTTLTGLAGDVASFYNIAQDEAYTKLKSVFTGETETLKDLGVVMTQSALDSYALANGFGKTTQAMSEQEKVALRYKFVQNQLQLATGDFIRTQDGWANQVRILKLQFDSLKATLGQGFINLFTPIIKIINVVLSKLATLANAFKAFTELITGKKAKSGAGVLDQTGKAADAAADSAGDAAGAVGGVGDSAGKAAKAAKELKNVTLGIDELNTIPDQSDDGSGGSGGSGGGASTGAEVDYGQLAEGETVLDEVDSKYAALIERIKELKNLFVGGWKIGIGDLSVLDSIKNQCDEIGTSLKDIFTDESVVKAANAYLNKLAFALGNTAGSIASAGLTIADNLTGGIAKYLDQNKDFIKSKIVNMFDVSGAVALKIGALTTTVAEIFTVFRSPEAKQITADIIAIFSNGFLEAGELVLKFGGDIVNLISDPIINNKDKIKEALNQTLAPIQTFTSTVRELVTDTAKKISEVYDTYISPAFSKISEGLGTVFGSVLDAYNKYLAPTLQSIADGFKKLKDEHLQKVIDKFLELVGNVVDCIATIWNAISPFVGYIAGEFVKVISEGLQGVWDVFIKVFGWISDIVSGLLTTLNGLITFIKGVFSGDWKLAWEGVKGIFSGIWETIKAVFSPFTNWLNDKVITPVKGMVAKIKSALGTVSDWISKKVLTPIKNGFDTFWNGVKKVCNSILGGIESMVNGVIRGINKMIDGLNSLKVDIPDWVPGVGGKSLGFSLGSISPVSLPRLAEGGYVKRNTPQLAMIGDNPRYGEVVAPENKLLEMAKLAAQSSQGDTSAIVAAIESLKQVILNKDDDRPIELILDGEVLYRSNQKVQRARGYDLGMGAFAR